MGIGVDGRLCLGRRGLVEPRQLGGGAGGPQFDRARVRELSTTMNVGTLSTWYRCRSSGLLVDVDRLDRISLADQLLDGRAHLLAGAAPFGMEVEQDRRRRVARGALVAVQRASNTEAMVMPPGLLSLGIARGPTSG